MSMNNNVYIQIESIPELNLTATEYAENVVVNTIEEDNNHVVMSVFGTPIFVNKADGIFTNRHTYWSTEETIAVKGFGEYYNQSYKPIFIFNGHSQTMNVHGSVNITGMDTPEPFAIQNKNLENLFKISTDELPVFKMHTEMKEPQVGALLFHNGDLYFGA